MWTETDRWREGERKRESLEREIDSQNQILVEKIKVNTLR